MKHPEQTLQTQIASYLRWALAEPWYFTAIGHGGGGRLRGMILKGMGVKRGVFDLLFMAPERFVGWIESKSLTGRLTEEQLAFQKMVLRFGHHTAVAKSVDDVRLILLSWNAPLRETKRSMEGIVRPTADDIIDENFTGGLRSEDYLTAVRAGDFPDSGPLVRRKGAK